MVPKEIVKEVNKELFHQNKNQYFLTLFVAVLNLKTGIVNYCNAAHTTSLILKENGSIQELAKTHGLPLGLYKDKEYTDSETKLSANDVLILYTDGITEMINSTGELFGENNFKEEIKKLKGNSPNEIITKIEKHLEEYRKGVKQSDDYSIVALKYLPN
jgi:sigma-B regulation protein RsbU (phosphoserine phosphatase)